MSTSSLGEILAGAAAQAAAMLDGRNLRLSPTGRVHAVGQVRWLGGVTAPGPLCHVGTASGPVAGIIPTDAPVSCARCLASRGIDPTGRQEPLPGLG
ncbi:hypothetical protein [Streptomyces sp. MP131-18]|uniref:hypothetical protein n=1 Tax=Streptomyces sp. MP131-18 TaxID=1857892 RepID=UPI00117C8B9F|nr:hypothetical protein [Streptomyces sp. MP131-18]